MNETVLRRDKGKMLSEPFLQKVFDTLKPTYYGCAVVYNGVLDVTVASDPSVEKIKEICEAFIDSDALIWLGQKPADEAGTQPFIAIKDEEENAHLAVVLGGDFSNFAKAGSSLPPAYHAYEDVVLPAITEMIENHEGDLAKVCHSIRQSKMFDGAMQNIGIKDSCCLMLSSTGMLKVFSNSSVGGDIEGGWASNLFGYKEGEYPEKSGAGKIKAAAGAAVAKIKAAVTTQKPAVAEAKIKPTEAKIKPEPTAKIKPPDQVNTEGPLMFKVPEEWDRLNNKARKNWQNANLGSLHTGWTEWKAGQMVEFTKSVKHLPVSSKLAEQLKSHPLADKSTEEPKGAGKDTSTHHIKPPADKPRDVVVGVAPPKQREDFQSTFMTSAEIKALQGKPAKTVEELQAEETKKPSFSEQAKLDLEATLDWSDKSEALLMQDYRDLAVARIRAFKVLVKKHYAQQKAAPAASATPPTAKIKPPVAKIKAA